MAVIPKKSTDFDVVRRSDFTLKLTIKDSTSSPLNLTGYNVSGQVYDVGRTKLYADWNVVYTNRSGGIVDIDLTDDQTATFTIDTLFYDIKLTQPDGKEFVYLRGKLNMLEGYTE